MPLRRGKKEESGLPEFQEATHAELPDMSKPDKSLEAAERARQIEEHIARGGKLKRE